MKQLILVRHAKSSWKNPSQSDHERPLSKRGERDAPFMAKIFAKKKLVPDVIISSDADRALSTAKEFAKRLDYKKEKIIRSPELYAADMDQLIDLSQSLDDEKNTVMLFGHNPGFTELANYLTGGSIENIPTCGVAGIHFEINHWSEVGQNGTLLFFEYPKLYFQNEVHD